MRLTGLLKDKVSIYDENMNLIKADEQASVQGGKKIITLNGDYPVQIGYFVERKTPSGVVEKYKVLEPNYSQGLQSIKPHYQMNVINVSAIPDPRTTSTVNNIHASGNARIYQHSVDNSTNTYTSTEYKEALNKVRSDILDLDLDPIDSALVAKAITKISEEVETGNPNKDKLGAYLSLLPSAVTALDSVMKLASMAGLG
jgi:hypothetical protein